MPRNCVPPSPGPGRPKGLRNRVTVAVKTTILEAFKLEGGVVYLRKVAKEDPRTFCALLGRLLPTELRGDLNVTMNEKLSVRLKNARERLRTQTQNQSQSPVTTPTAPQSNGGHDQSQTASQAISPKE